MTARTHDLAAITALGVVVLAHPPEALRLSTALIAILANQLGGIAPDIDQPTAPLWRNLPEGRFFGRLFSRLSGGHRFLSHSLFGLILFAWLANLLLHFIHPLMPHVDIQLVWYAFLIGMASHLVMDSFTKEGVPWLLPIPVKFGLPPLKKFRVTTGKKVESLIIFPGLLAVLIWLLTSHYTELTTIIHQNIIR